jgi:hypothetical protein
VEELRDGPIRFNVFYEAENRMVTTVVKPASVIVTKGGEQEFIKVEDYPQWQAQGWVYVATLWEKESTTVRQARNRYDL